MHPKIITEPLSLTIYGFSGTAINKDYSGTAFRLMDKMWKAVRSEGLKNKGMNIWVYEPDEKIFAGIALLDNPEQGSELEQKNITLLKYAYYKHIGPYQLIGRSGQMMRDQLKEKGLSTTLPYIEIYGHWMNDETKLETELLMSLA